MPMSRFNRLILVSLGLTWSVGISHFAQASNPPGAPTFSEPNPHAVASASQPATTCDCSLVRGAENPLDLAAEAPSSSADSPPAPFGGPIMTRSKLTGDWFGLREDLRDDGFTFDISATTYYRGTASGGLQDTFRSGGRNDYLLNVDGGKAGLWQGFGIYLHGETLTTTSKT